jgi:TolA-binding protein
LAQFPGLPEKINMPELTKEIFSQLGYKDGSRFVEFSGDDPRVAELEQQLQQLQMQIQTDQTKTEGRIQIEQVKSVGDKEVAQIKAQADIQSQMIRQESDIIEAQIKKDDSVTKRGELILQRDALLNQIKETERQLELEAEGSPGTIERDRYNKIPYAVG